MESETIWVVKCSWTTSDGSKDFGLHPVYSKEEIDSLLISLNYPGYKLEVLECQVKSCTPAEVKVYW